MTLLDVATPATGLFAQSWLLIAIPGVVAVLLLVGGKLTDAWGHIPATLAPIASFAIGLVLFLKLLGRGAGQRSMRDHLYQFLSSGRWHVDVSLQVDQLSIIFVLLITGVGSLIHIYSVGYMAHDPNRRRFFAYMNLFVGSMLLLVLADNYLILFVGWEGVGLASYLLIGFWQQRPTAATAAKKAFVMNRVGDMGMSIAIGFMLYLFGSTAFSDVNAGAGQMGNAQATILGLLFLLAACGKSAQVPLQAWLLDAMEGPTPVSALIHAATMVTAGVYLIVRSHAVFEQSATAQLVVAIIGTITLLVGAWIGCAKDDIKKVLAGSTMSQIGYMMLGAGLGPPGYAFAIFHLVTHGFFKADLFLGAGSIMHSTDDEVDMRRFGALRRLLPITFVTFGIAYLAIIGFPFLSGFYSKDHIIDAAFDQDPILGALAMLGAAVTAFYMTRLMIMTYFGRSRYDEGVHPHESPPVMTIPLIILGVGSIGAGLALNNWIGNWLAPSVGGTYGNVTGLLHFTLPGIITLVLVAIGVAIAIWMFGLGRRIPAVAPASRSPFTLAGRKDVYGDVINEAVFMRPGEGLVAGVARTDTGVDETGLGITEIIAGVGSWLRRWQTGFVRSYALTMIAGAFAVGIIFALGRLG